MSLPSLWIWTLWSSPLAKLKDVGVKMSGSFSLFNRYQICKLPVGCQWDARKAGNLRQKWDRIKSAQHTLNGSFPFPLMRVIASLTAVLKYEKHRKRCSPPIITIIVIIIYRQFESNQKKSFDWLIQHCDCNSRDRTKFKLYKFPSISRSVHYTIVTDNIMLVPLWAKIMAMYCWW